MRFSEFRIDERRPLVEGARIQHAEDIIFWEGSKGAVRAIESLKSLEQGAHQDVTIKWDGSPAVIFGRDDEGNFVFTDKSGFTAKGYDGKSKSADDLRNMFLNRSGGKNRENPGYVAFANKMAAAYDDFERAVSTDFRGYLKGDMLYFETPPEKNGQYIFKPNVVTYAVDADSDIGRRIGNSTSGIVIHRLVDESGAERALAGNEIETIMQGDEVLVLPPVTAQEPPQIDDSAIKELQSIVSKNSAAIDAILDEEMLRQNKVSDLPTVFYTYLNSKVDTGLTDLAKGFVPWLKQSKVSPAKQQKIIDIINSNVNGFNAIWQLVAGVMRVKDNIIQQLESQNAPIKSSINGQAGGEGYVLAHPEGDIKLVSREFFTKANRAVER
jgi:hypothetical protein